MIIKIRATCNSSVALTFEEDKRCIEYRSKIHLYSEQAKKKKIPEENIKAGLFPEILQVNSSCPCGNRKKKIKLERHVHTQKITNTAFGDYFFHEKKGQALLG